MCIPEEIVGAAVGSLLATLGAIIVMYLQRSSDGRRERSNAIEQAKLNLLANAQGLRRERFKAAESVMHIRKSLLDAKLLKQTNPKGVDKNSSITTDEYFIKESWYKASRLDAHNDRAHSYEIEVNKYRYNLTKLFPEKTAIINEKVKLLTAFRAAELSGIPKRIESADDSDRVQEMVDAFLDKLKKQYLLDYTKLELFIDGLSD